MSEKLKSGISEVKGLAQQVADWITPNDKGSLSVPTDPAILKKNQTNRERLEKMDSENYRAWNEQLANGLSMDEAYTKALEERDLQKEKDLEEQRLQQFNGAMSELSSGPKEGRRVFALADQIRKARAEFQRLLNEGEFDEDEYRQLVSDREDALQDLLIKYKNSITLDQQDFIIDFSGGTYDELVASQIAEEDVAPVVRSTPSDKKVVVQTEVVNQPEVQPEVELETQVVSGPNVMVETEVVSQPEEMVAESNQPVVTVYTARRDGVQQTEIAGDPASSPSETPELAIPEEGISANENLEADTLTRVRFVSGGIESDENDEDDESELENPELLLTDDESDLDSSELLGPQLEEFWLGLGIREDLAEELLLTDPDLYARYVQARDKFVTDQANARGAGLPPSEQKAGWMQRIRSRLPERFNKGGQQPPASQEEFDLVYKNALDKVLLGYSDLSPGELYERRMSLEANAGYALEWDISKKKMDASGEKKSSLSRKAAMFGGLGLAAALGAGTGVWERLQKGEHDLKFLGMAAVLGAATGYGVSKKYQPQEDESNIETNAYTAEQTVLSEYQKNSPDSMQDRTMGIESAQTVTKSEKKKALGRTAVGIFGGAAAGVGGHLVIDTLWPMLSGIGTEKISDGPAGTGIVAEPVVEMNPLDSDNNGVVNSIDMPDRNGDGLITIDDSFDPLDSNRDGEVTNDDMPDTDDNGTIDRRDDVPAETFDPLDTNEDGKVDSKDWPDTNDDGVVDYRDEKPVETESPATTAETDGRSITVENKSSFTNEFMQLYDNLSAGQSHELYHYLDERFGAENIFQGDSTYLMPDGEWGLHSSERGEVTMPTEIDDAARNWIETNVK